MSGPGFSPGQRAPGHQEHQGTRASGHHETRSPGHQGTATAEVFGFVVAAGARQRPSLKTSAKMATDFSFLLILFSLLFKKLCLILFLGGGDVKEFSNCIFDSYFLNVDYLNNLGSNVWANFGTSTWSD